jgi:hypothetical protein
MTVVPLSLTEAVEVETLPLSDAEWVSVAWLLGTPGDQRSG